MAITVKHKFVSAIPDAGDTSVVQPSNWNDDHQLTGTVPVANGGTGAATANDALTNLLPSQTGNSGKVLSTDGTNTNWISAGGTGTVTSVTGTAPISVATGTTTPVISMTAANTSTNGYLTSTDWNTFNNKQPAGSYLTGVTVDAPLSGAGTSASHLVISQANSTTNGYLTSTDWNTFNSKGSGSVTSVSGTGSVNGITLTGTITSSGSLTLGGTLGSIANSQLTNSSITFGSTAAALGTTVSALNAVSIGATTPSTGAFTYTSTNGTTSITPVLSFNASNSNMASGASVANSYLQNMLQNKSGTAGASTNYVLSNDLGTDSTYYGEFGMNSSVYSSGTPSDFFSLNNGIYFSGHDGDLTLGSGNGYKTYFAWGTSGQSAHVINASGAIGLNTSITGSTNFGTSGQVLTSAGSAATPTWTTPTTGTVTSVSESFTGGLLSVSGSPITSTGTFNWTVAGTSGGIPYFSSASTWASSAALTQYGVVYGGGAGAAPAATAAGTTGQVLTAVTGGAPVWGSAGSGTVTSVAATVPAFLSVSGSPITTSGTLAISLSGTALPVANGGTGTTTSTGTGSVVLGTRPTMSVTGASFTLQDATDNTKQANFVLSGLTTGTSYTYALPNQTGSTIAVLGLSQSWSQNQTFAGGLTATGGTLNLSGNTVSAAAFGTSASTGTQTIGGTSQTGTMTLGQSTASQTTNIQAGATTTGNTKAINLGTNGASGSTTTIIIGSTTGTSTTTVNGVLKQQTYTVATLPSAATSGTGARSFVTDALAPTFGATVAGSGAVAVPVYSDGTNWKVG